MTLFDRTYQVLALLATAPVLIKIAIFFVVWGLLWLPIAVPLSRFLHWQPSQPITVQQKLPLVGSLYILAPLILRGFAGIEGVSFATYGWVWSLGQLISLSQGLALGAIGLLLLFTWQAKLGWVIWQWDNVATLRALAGPTLLLGLGIGAIEELIFRGFLLNQFSALTDLQALPSSWSAVIAAALTSIIFALLHLVWEGAENIPQLPGLWMMGMVLCGARWVDHGSLGLAWGLHTGWIWIMANLDTAQLLGYPGSVPAWLTGLGQKPLAGLMGLFFLMSTGLLLGIGFLGQYSLSM